MSIKIRGRDGAIREVNDGYVLRDGETMVVELQFLDARTVIHDGNGRRPGQGPGFLVCDDEQAEQAVAAAYRQYAQDISERWRQGLGQPKQPESAPQTFESPEAALAAAYAEYDRTICERWRR
jgi:hypothetical protein